MFNRSCMRLVALLCNICVIVAKTDVVYYIITPVSVMQFLAYSRMLISWLVMMSFLLHHQAGSGHAIWSLG